MAQPDGDGDGDDKTLVIRPSAAGKRQPPPPAEMTCVNPEVLKGGPGAAIRLADAEIRIGRASENAVTLKADGISRSHARIYPGDGVWGVEDLGSTNGVRVNNSKVEQSWLQPGDTVAIGRVCYKYALAQEKTEPSAPPQLDIGDAEKTVIMRPGQRPPEAEEAIQRAAAKPGPVFESEAPPARAAAPAAGEPGPASAREPRPTPRPSPTRKPEPSGSGRGVWVLLAAIVAIVVVVVLFI